MNPLISPQTAGAVAMGLATVAGFFGLEIDGGTQKLIAQLLMVLGTFVGTGLVIWGNVKAARTKRALVQHAAELTAQVEETGAVPAEPSVTAAKAIAAVEKTTGG